MPYLIGFVAIVIGIYIGVWLVVAGLMLYVLPAMLVAVLAALPVGAVLGVVTAMITLTGVWAPPAVVRPDQITAGYALRSKRRKRPFPRDFAWPSYYATQARIDLAQVWRANSKLLGDGWRWIRRGLRNEWPVMVPTLAIACPLWLCVSIGAYAASAVIITMGAAVLFVLGLCWFVPTALLRAGDRLVRKLRRASGSCPHCYHVTELPTFACPGCGRPHRDIRPGWLGGTWRRCGCGALLPTTVLRIARVSAPQCPRCDKPLRRGGAVVTDVRLPVFGPASAGKTRLVYTGLQALRDQVAGLGGSTDFVDDDSQQAYDHAIALVGAGGDTVKTPEGELPPAITVRLTTGRRRALLHLFDAAGEVYGDRDENTNLEFLDHAQGLIFVVDPFSIPWVRDQLGNPADSNILSRANPAKEDPEWVYHVTARRLRDYGVATRKRNLAVTVVKADLLDHLALGTRLTPDRVRAWLVEAGLDNLVLSTERDFGEVGYFVTASLSGVRATDPRSPARPIAWLSARAGLELWPDPHQGAGPQEKETEEVV